jgi:hypothetical protein
MGIELLQDRCFDADLKVRHLSRVSELDAGCERGLPRDEIETFDRREVEAVPRVIAKGEDSIRKSGVRLGRLQHPRIVPEHDPQELDDRCLERLAALAFDVHAIRHFTRDATGEVALTADFDELDAQVRRAAARDGVVRRVALGLALDEPPERLPFRDVRLDENTRAEPFLCVSFRLREER